MTEKVALLLEDQSLIAVDIAQTLMEAGYFVHIFQSCATAHQWMNGEHPVISIAVIDVLLSDGPCSKIAQDLAANGVPFVVHSGTLEQDLEEPFRAGILVPKPSPAEAMLGAVRRAIERLA